MKKYVFPDPQFYEKVKDRLERGEYRIRNGRLVCETCGSNCGQCGDTDVLGNFTDQSGIMGGFVSALFKDNARRPRFSQRIKNARWLKAYAKYVEQEGLK